MADDDAYREWLTSIAEALEDLVGCLIVALLGSPEECVKRLKPYYALTVQIDGDPIELQIARMSTPAITAMEEQMKRCGFNVATLEPLPALATAEETATWLVTVIAENCSVPPGQLEMEEADGTVREVRTGRELVALYGGRQDIIPIVVASIWGENRLSEAQKVPYRAAVARAILGTLSATQVAAATAQRAATDADTAADRPAWDDSIPAVVATDPSSVASAPVVSPPGLAASDPVTVPPALAPDPVAPEAEVIPAPVPTTTSGVAPESAPELAPPPIAAPDHAAA